MGGSARASAERDGRGRLATGGGGCALGAGPGERGELAATAAARPQPPGTRRETLGLLSAGRGHGAGGRSDAPRGMRAEDEVAARRAGPGSREVAPGES